jgi:hypothetical protein
VLHKVTEASKELAVVTSSVNDARSIAVVLSPVSLKKSKETEIDAKTQNP